MVTRKRTKDDGSQCKEHHDKSDKNGKKAESSSGKSMIPYRRIGVRFFVIMFAMIVLNVYSRWNNLDLEVFVSSQESVEKKSVAIPCSNDYEKEREMFPECAPRKCGRFVMDELVTKEEARRLRKTAKAGLALGGSKGGASILDLHSGALSKGDKFINIFRLMQDSGQTIFSESDFKLYVTVKDKIHAAIASAFGVRKDKLYLTKPTFFSRMTTTPAKTIHDQYWHVHTDKVTYGSFHYTSLLYLTTYNEDFTGGRFIFVDSGKNTTVEPKLGRLSFFTSGSENPHYVEKLEGGTRYAITVSFTCDPEQAIPDPNLRAS